jgi:hypothetical protein
MMRRQKGNRGFQRGPVSFFCFLETDQNPIRLLFEQLVRCHLQQKGFCNEPSHEGEASCTRHDYFMFAAAVLSLLQRIQSIDLCVHEEESCRSVT